MRHTFESLGYQSGFYLSQLFSSTRNTASPSSSVSSKLPHIPTRPPPPLFNWGPRQLPSPSPTFQNPAQLRYPHTKDETHLFLHPHSSETRMEDMIGDRENDIKWPNGLSFFNALTGRSDDTKLLFNPDPNDNHQPLNPNSDASNMLHTNPNEFLSLDSHSESARKMENKFKRSFTLPARMASLSSNSLDHHHHPHNNPLEYKSAGEGMYSDVMEAFLE